jgi:hypothetical protein
LDEIVFGRQRRVRSDPARGWRHRHLRSQLSSVDPGDQEAGLQASTSNGLFYELTYNPVGPTSKPSTGKLNPSQRAIEADELAG